MANLNPPCDHPGCLRRHKVGSESYLRAHGNGPGAIPARIDPETVEQGNRPSPFPIAMESKQGLVPCTIVVDHELLWTVLKLRIEKLVVNLIGQERSKQEILADGETR